MNKQFVIAALFAATNAQANCEDANTKLADRALKAATERKVALEKAKVAMDTLDKSEAALLKAAQADLDKYAKDAKPHGDDFTTADTNYKAEFAKYTAAKDKIAADAAGLTKLATAKSTADTAMKAQQTIIDKLKKDKLDLDAQLTMHAAEKAAFLKVKTTADALVVSTKKTQDTAQAAADKEKNAVAAIDVATATSTESTKKTAYTDAVKAEKAAYDAYVTDRGTQELWKKDNVVDAYTAACPKDDTKSPKLPICVLGDTVFGWQKTATDAQSNANTALATKKTAWTNLQAPTATAYSVWAAAAQKLKDVTAEQTAAKALQSTADTALTAAKQAQTDAIAAAKTAADNDTKSAGEVTTATENQSRQATLIAAAEAKLVTLRDAYVIATHMHKLADDINKAQEVIKTASDTRAKQLLALQVIAKATNERAQKKIAFYTEAVAAAKVGADAAAAKVTAQAALIKTATDAITKATAAQKVAVAACKGLMYETAQQAYKDFKAKETKDKQTASDVKAAYDKLIVVPTDGSANTRCEKPAKAADGTQAARTECKENLCCGSANKFLRDGTRLTVETCQNAKDTVVYKFYPKLQTGALVQPEAEFWRFYCIMGAQKLAATMAAGAAAAYFMA